MNANSSALHAASLWLLEKLTNNGIIPFPLACARLTAWESILVKHVLGRSDVHVLDEPLLPGPLIRITNSALFGLAFWDVDEQPRTQAEVQGWLHVPPQVLDMVVEETRSAASREAAELSEIDAIAHDWAVAGELDRRLVELAGWLPAPPALTPHSPDCGWVVWQLIMGWPQCGGDRG
ncbi:MAG: hypothetical protein ACRDU4_07505 [Mycobacterium sp.]